MVRDGKLKLYHKDDVDDDKLYSAMEGFGLKRENERYDYLLSMQMRSMTAAKLDELQREIDKLKAKIAELEGKSEKDLWREDLDNFKKAYTKFLTTRKEE